MAIDSRDAVIALHRFGFGPRPGTIAAIASDPRGALQAELDRANAGQVPSAGLLSSGVASRTAFEFNAERAAQRRLEAKRQDAANQEAAKQSTAQEAGVAAPAMQNPTTEKPATAKPADAGTPPKGAAPPTAVAETPIVENFFREAKAHYDAAIRAEIGFVERLVWFWSNHFCVSADATAMAGAYEREAIRPHVLGKFADLLLAAESHPAMLLYLDNATSMGPNSVAGLNRNRGLNENLGREILELHTLGAGAGYTQEDVTSFAKVITGWTFYDTGFNPDHGGEFLYHRLMHEPGPQTVLGKSYRDTGLEQGRAVLADLARRPATALHVATKLARHFVADEPPPELVATLASTFISTDGDLWQVAKALVAAPEAWTPQQAKIKRPSEWMMACLRAAGLNGDVRRTAPALTRLGEPLWRPPAPRGFSDENGAWLEGLAHRLDTANAFAQANAERLDPNAMLDTALGPLSSAETRTAVARAETRQQGLTLLLMAPEFLRR